MKRRDFLALCAASVLGTPALAQDRAKPARIGVASQGTGADEETEAFRKEFAAMGYAEGRDIVIEWRYAAGDAARLSALVAELLAFPVDILVTRGTPASLVAKRLTTTVPIVIQSGDPVGAGLVASLARPGGNITGTSILSGDYNAKWLELLR